MIIIEKDKIIKFISKGYSSHLYNGLYPASNWNIFSPSAQNI